MSRTFSNPVMDYLRQNHPHLLTPSGAIDASQFSTAQDAANFTTALIPPHLFGRATPVQKKEVNRNGNR